MKEGPINVRGEELDNEIEAGEWQCPSPPENDLKIVMTHHVQQQIDEFAASDHSRELAGVLLGAEEELASDTQLTVTAMIKAKKTSADQPSVTITHESWRQIYREKEILYPELRIVGWFLTHPGYGITLTVVDLFNQQHFFNLPGQVLYVVDPLSNEKGFFAWQGQHFKPVSYYTDNKGQKAWVQESSLKSEPESSTQIKSPLRDNAAQRPRHEGERRTSGWLKAALAVSLLLLALTNFHRLKPAETVLPEETAIPEEQTLSEQEQPIPEREQVEALTNELQLQQEQIAELEADLHQMERLVAELSGDRLFVYTVLPGDSLTAISNRFFNDPNEYQYLMRLNNLDDPDALRAGQQLLIYRTDD
ncbi:MAG: LysM peptidoglycan-binding domain-containing protein [Bacillota bacterium]|nr:LysM peptidoglycan-binding domain-containing protein [Bacillota bacterium]MDW7676345.1 LysM peptidoglycan-binding domain-containing protein [Bacillota bacterium]